ncbi:MAG TPA: hypothetical protein VER17_02580 [Tepidisphaeraceae bacterium]|nr:hypothetical protein [Tepidisphaeraceae bacterium]
MRRLPHILLLLAFVLLGTGTLERLHNLAHRHEDARHAATHYAAATHHAGQQHAAPQHATAGDEGLATPPDPRPAHDESNCDLHRRLHLPLMSAGYVPLLICLGLFVAFLTQLAPALVSQLACLRLDCRGPPAC